MWIRRISPKLGWIPKTHPLRGCDLWQGWAMIHGYPPWIDGHPMGRNSIQMGGSPNSMNSKKEVLPFGLEALHNIFWLTCAPLWISWLIMGLLIAAPIYFALLFTGCAYYGWTYTMWCSFSESFLFVTPWSSYSEGFLFMWLEAGCIAIFSFWLSFSSSLR